jgi:zinc protease
MLIAIQEPLAANQFDPIRWQTQAGTHVVLYRAMEVPMLNISLAFKAGSAYDAQNFGLSALTTRLINQGNLGFNAQEIAQQLANTGAQFQGQADRDMVVLNLKTLSNHTALNAAINTFAMVISHPDFTQQAFAQEQQQQLNAIAQIKNLPDEVANQTFFQALYHHHPYAHPILGDEQSVKNLNIQQVRDFYHQFFVKSNAYLIFVGAIDKKEADALAKQLLKDLPKGQEAPDIQPAKPLTEEINIEVRFPSSQTVLRLGQLGITHQDPNYFPLHIGNYILGGGHITSQLSRELRGNRGLTYGVHSQFSPMPGVGPFLIACATKALQIKSAIKVIDDTLVRFINEGPTEEELSAAKKYLTGSFPISLSSNQTMAEVLLRIAFYHLPDDYLKTYIRSINHVTRKDIQKAFQQTINPHNLLQVTVGKEDK